jgi:hypothetical protein
MACFWSGFKLYYLLCNVITTLCDVRLLNTYGEVMIIYFTTGLEIGWKYKS